MLKQRTEQIFINGTPLLALIKELQGIVNKYGEDTFFNVSVEYDYGDEYAETSIVYYTEETPLEATERLAAEEFDKVRALKHKREQYEALKKEFGE